jgi:rare lipoprotein A
MKGYHVLRVFSMCLVVPVLAGCATTNVDASSTTMNASWYMHGKRTANGERFNPNGLTAAHRSLPFGTRLHLTHGNRTAIVRINDRGPFVRGRQLDLSRGAAQQLGCIKSGSCKIIYRVVN